MSFPKTLNVRLSSIDRSRGFSAFGIRIPFPRIWMENIFIYVLLIIRVVKTTTGVMTEFIQYIHNDLRSE